MDSLDLLQLRNQIFENLKKGFEELEFQINKKFNDEKVRMENDLQKNKFDKYEESQDEMQHAFELMNEKINEVMKKANEAYQ